MQVSKLIGGLIATLSAALSFSAVASEQICEVHLPNIAGVIHDQLYLPSLAPGFFKEGDLTDTFISILREKGYAPIVHRYAEWESLPSGSKILQFNLNSYGGLRKNLSTLMTKVCVGLKDGQEPFECHGVELQDKKDIDVFAEYTKILKQFTPCVGTKPEAVIPAPIPRTKGEFAVRLRCGQESYTNHSGGSSNDSNYRSFRLNPDQNEKTVRGISLKRMSDQPESYQLSLTGPDKKIHDGYLSDSIGIVVNTDGTLTFSYVNKETKKSIPHPQMLYIAWRTWENGEYTNYNKYCLVKFDTL